MLAHRAASRACWSCVKAWSKSLSLIQIHGFVLVLWFKPIATVQNGGFCPNVAKPSHHQLPVNMESLNALIEEHEILFSVLTLSANKYHVVSMWLSLLQDKDVIFGTAHSRVYAMVKKSTGCNCIIYFTGAEILMRFLLIPSPPPMLC